MKKIAIIGAGQLGSRHLQGVLRYNKSPLVIYVIDTSADALSVSKARSDEIVNDHKIVFHQNWKCLPLILDLVIVATNSDIRESVITNLMDKCKIIYLILEKVLFTDLMAYNRINELLMKKSVKTWVNHPRRMINTYRDLKRGMGNGFSGSFQVVGGNWGLGSNGLHFIDFFEYLCDSKTKTIDTEWVDRKINESKRKGFVEFTGTIKGKLDNGTVFQITSLDEATSAATITVFNSENRIIIQEAGTTAIYHLKMLEGFKQTIISFTMDFQSSLTTSLLDDLFEKGSCNLPTYKEAKQTHELFIGALLNVYNSIKRTDTYILPIT